MKLPAGTLKVIFVSRMAIAENRARSTVKGAKLVPPWIVFVHTPATKAFIDLTSNPAVEVPAEPAKTECYAAHSFKGAKLTPKANFRDERPYPWMPSTRPGNPRESLLGTAVWLETTEELNINTKDQFNG